MGEAFGGWKPSDRALSVVKCPSGSGPSLGTLICLAGRQVMACRFVESSHRDLHTSRARWTRRILLA